MAPKSYIFVRPESVGVHVAARWGEGWFTYPGT